MTHALIQEGRVVAYPYSFAQLRKDNPQVSYPRSPDDARLTELGVVKVASADRPTHDPITQNVVEGEPAFVDKVLTQVWTVVDASQGEIAQRQAEADWQAKEAALAEHSESVKEDSFVAQFLAMTPAEATAYVEASVTNLASAKALLHKITLMLLILAKREFRS